MDTIHLIRQMARYNAWSNEKIYSVCARVTDQERKRDLGAFFGSIHATLNHLLLTDRMWLARMRYVPFSAQSLRDEVTADFDELRRQRIETDAEITAWLANYCEADLDRELTYTSLATGSARSYLLRHVWLHIGNHQTHHRGQITALLQQLGYDYGDVDLLFMPVALASNATEIS
jgi:uncharacterized damage-inducible protein DinB